jgi:hypothetical protein
VSYIPNRDNNIAIWNIVKSGIGLVLLELSEGEVRGKKCVLGQNRSLSGFLARWSATTGAKALILTALNAAVIF